MADSRKINLIFCLHGIFCLNLFVWWVYVGLFKKSYWQPWFWYLFTSHWAVYLESSFTSVGNDLGIYVTLMLSNCSGERSFSSLQMVEWTKEHH